MPHRTTELFKGGVTLTGDERHGYEWSLEKGPTTANKKFMQLRGVVLNLSVCFKFSSVTGDNFTAGRV